MEKEKQEIDKISSKMEQFETFIDKAVEAAEKENKDRGYYVEVRNQLKGHVTTLKGILYRYEILLRKDPSIPPIMSEKTERLQSEFKTFCERGAEYLNSLCDDLQIKIDSMPKSSTANDTKPQKAFEGYVLPYRTKNGDVLKRKLLTMQSKDQREEIAHEILKAEQDDIISIGSAHFRTFLQSFWPNEIKKIDSDYIRRKYNELKES